MVLSWPRDGPPSLGFSGGRRDAQMRAMKTSTGLAGCPAIEWSQQLSNADGLAGGEVQPLLINLFQMMEMKAASHTSSAVLFWVGGEASPRRGEEVLVWERRGSSYLGFMENKDAKGRVEEGI